MVEEFLEIIETTKVWANNPSILQMASEYRALLRFEIYQLGTWLKLNILRRYRIPFQRFKQ